MTALEGHDEPWREWRAALQSPRMHHAWILAGVQGLGKGAFARAAAAELVTEPGVQQPAPGHHPDILIPEHPPENKEETKKREDGQPWRTKRSIPIDEIRALQHRLNTRPTLGSRRAVIIDPADDLEKNAVNALLKSLEEPPAGTYFLLVTHRIGRLLPTIRSRCRVLRFAPLPDAAIDQVLAREAPQADAATRHAAIAAAQGSPGTALAFVEQDLAPIHSLMQALLREGDPEFARRGQLIAAVGTKPTRERLAAILDLARAELARALPDAGRERQLRLIEVHAELVRLAGQIASFNYDNGLLAVEIGSLLAGTANPRETVR